MSNHIGEIERCSEHPDGLAPVNYWEQWGCKLEVWYKRTCPYSHPMLARSECAYRFEDTEEGVVFEGDTYSPSPVVGLSSEELVADLLQWITIDSDSGVDPEFFDDYTPEQLEWLKTVRRMDVYMEAIVLEEHCAEED